LVHRRLQQAVGFHKNHDLASNGTA
jgi:hypothetical protein